MSFPARVVLAILSLAPIVSAYGQDLLSSIPSARYLLMSSPWSPTSYGECDALQQEFSQEVAQLNAQHEACLQGAPSDDPNGGGSCSKASCQAVHSARDAASRKSVAETGICRKRVGEYLAAQRREEEARRRAQEAAEREARQREREEAERKAAREAERRQDDRRRADEDAERRREQELADARADRERREQQARSAAERDSKAREDAAAKAKADKDAAERAQRESEWAAIRAQQEAANALAFARAEKARVEREEREKNLYADLIVQLKEKKDQVELAGHVIDTFKENPFRTAVKKLAAEGAAAVVGSKAVEKAVDRATPIGPEKHDSRYEAVVAMTDEARSQALSTNPAAEQVSGLAAEGVHQINRKVLGQIDELGRQMDRVSASDASPRKPGSQTYVPPRTGGPASMSTSSSSANPFRRESTTGQQTAASNSSAASSSAQQDRSSASTTFDDPDSGRSYVVASGQSLYRNPGTGSLSVVNDTGIATSDTGDRMVNGQLQCSASGKGRVIPECEKKRKHNPFKKK